MYTLRSMIVLQYTVDYFKEVYLKLKMFVVLRLNIDAKGKLTVNEWQNIDLKLYLMLNAIIEAILDGRGGDMRNDRRAVDDREWFQRKSVAVMRWQSVQ